jgi:hypothetical protein
MRLSQREASIVTHRRIREVAIAGKPYARARCGGDLEDGMCGLLRFLDSDGELEDDDLGDDVHVLLRLPDRGGGDLEDGEGSAAESGPVPGDAEEEAHAGGEDEEVRRHWCQCRTSGAPG